MNNSKTHSANNEFENFVTAHIETAAECISTKPRAKGGAYGVMVIIVGNGHGDTSSNPRRDWLHFTLH